MSAKDANKENEGAGPAGAAANPGLGKDVVIFSTDMSEEARRSIVGVATRAFHAPVNHGKVYRTIADGIRAECEKGCLGGAGGSGGGGDGPSNGGGGEAPGGGAGGPGGGAAGSGGWSCVVGDESPFFERCGSASRNANDDGSNLIFLLHPAMHPLPRQTHSVLP